MSKRAKWDQFRMPINHSTMTKLLGKLKFQFFDTGFVRLLVFKLKVGLAIILILFFSGPIQAGELGKPLITHYQPYQYGGEEQNWSMLLGPTGNLYVGNGEGILEYDGEQWELIKTTYNGPSRSLSMDARGRIYTGGNNSFGYLEKNQYGQMQFVDLSVELAGEAKIFNEIQSVLVVGEQVYFVANKWLFRYNKDKSISRWEYQNGRYFTKIFLFEDQVYFTAQKAMMTLNDKDELVVAREFVDRNGAHLMVVDTVHNQNRELIFTMNGVYYKDGDFPYWDTVAGRALKKTWIYHAARYNENLIAVTTVRQGLFLLTNDGSSIINISKTEGLSSEITLGFTPDNQDGLWLGLYSGLSRIQSPATARFIEGNSALKRINTLIKHQQILLATSLSDLALLNPEIASADSQFIHTDITRDSLSSVIETGVNSILVGGGFGIDSIKLNILQPSKSSLTHIADFKAFVIEFIKSPWNEEEYFVRLQNGVGRVRYRNKQWHYERIEQIKQEISSFAFDAQGLWLTSRLGDIFLIKKFDHVDALNIIEYDFYRQLKNAQLKLVSTSEGILLLLNNQFLRFNVAQQTFNRVFEHSMDIQLFQEDRQGRYWLAGKRDIGVVNKYLESGVDFTLSKIIGPGLTLDLLFDEDISYIVRQDKIITVTQPLSKMDLARPSLKSIRSRSRPLAYLNTDELSEHELQITVSLPDFSASGRKQYRFRLDDEGWTSWSPSNSIYYNKILGGQYQLHIQAQNGVGEVSSAQYPLSIALYWYQTLWFKLVLLLAVILLVNAIIKFSTYRLNKRNRQLEELVSQRTQVISEQATELRRVNQVRGTFFTNISHELRTPLTLIISPLEEIIEGRYGPLAGSYSRELSLILKSAKSMQGLLNQVLDLNRMENCALSLSLESLDLVDEIKRHAEPFALLAKKQNITFVQKYFEHSLRVKVDPKGLKSIIDNLLSNAFKFTAEGGMVEFSLSVEQDVIIIKVSDTGCGIEENELAHIFEQYYQADSSNYGLYSGTGIGLAMVREYIKLHGGDVQVSSTLGKGSCFSAKIPLIEDKEIGLLQNKNSGNMQKAVKFECTQTLPQIESESERIEDEDRTTVLVVEDNEELRQFLIQHLAQTYRVLQAENGRQGFDIALQYLPDMIISDIMMPVMNGHQLCAEIKSRKETLCIPLLLLTAKASDKDLVLGLDEGADDYLRKPFSMPELLARTNRLIESRRLLKIYYNNFDSRCHLVTHNIADFAAKNTENKIDIDPASDLIEQIRVVVLSQIDKGLTVTTLASAVSMDRTTLFRKLKTATGKTPTEIIREIRLEEAAKMLKRGEGSVSEIAYGLGYNNLGYFTKIFKSQFDLLPSEFKSKNRQSVDFV